MRSAIIGQTPNVKITTKTQRLLDESKWLKLCRNEEQLRKNAIMVDPGRAGRSTSAGAQIQEVVNPQSVCSAFDKCLWVYFNLQRKSGTCLWKSVCRTDLSYSKEDKIGGCTRHPYSRAESNKFCSSIADTPGESKAQYTIYAKTAKDLKPRVKPLHDPAIRGIIFNTQDITERKRPRRKKNEGRMQSLSNSPDMIMRINTQG